MKRLKDQTDGSYASSSGRLAGLELETELLMMSGLEDIQLAELWLFSPNTGPADSAVL